MISYIQHLERAIVINKQLDILVGDVAYVVGMHRNNMEHYSYLQSIDGRNTFAVMEMSLNEIIKEAWKLKVPKWIKLDTVCTNLINTNLIDKPVWINQGLKVTIVSIHRNSIIDTEGREWLSNKLWIKE